MTNQKYLQFLYGFRERTQYEIERVQCLIASQRSSELSKDMMKGLGIPTVEEIIGGNG